jgi:assimilatory nitrate reductase catalytic subunit
MDDASTHPAEATTRTTCAYCGVGCGVEVRRSISGGFDVVGDPLHPANYGRICVKGAALGETLSLERRLLHPRIHGQLATWNQAVRFIADGLKSTLEAHGPDAIAFYLSGQMLTEDYYVANKFAKGFLGTPHVDTNSRLCMASSVAGHRRAFGSDTVPNNYQDLDEADLIILVGSNAAWCHPVLYQRMQVAREKRGTKLINIDTRRTATTEGSDLHLNIRAGMDSVLFAWLLSEIAACEAIDNAYVTQHTTGAVDAIARSRLIAPDIETVAVRTGLAVGEIEAFVDLFLSTARTVTCYSQGVNQSAQGTDKVNAILNCHLATGRIGKRGCGPLSLTGQPNAMGGREVGGLANMLAAHMGYGDEDVDRVSRFWNAPGIARREGLKAVQMFEAIERGKIKALWVMHTNPAVTMPRADAMRDALRKLDLFVVSEAMEATDTTLCQPHVMLPAAAWGEKSGTVTNSERRISRQRAFLPPPGETRPDWQHISLVAQRMGFKAGFDYDTPAQIFREHAALSAFENGGERDFDIGSLARLSDEDYELLKPVQWPCAEGREPQERLFADGSFFTPDRRGRLISIEQPALALDVSEDYPFLLNTGRVRDHWHTMMRTGLSTRLARHVGEPLLSIHPDDARALGVDSGGYVRVESEYGAATLKANIDDGLAKGAVFAPIHWNDMTSGLSRIDSLVAPKVDPYSGQPELKATPVKLSPVDMECEGFLVTTRRAALPLWLQHSRITVPGGEAVVFASVRQAHALHALLINHIGQASSRAELDDPASEEFRTVSFDGNRLAGALFIQRKRDNNALEWVIDCIAKEELSATQMKALLAGRATTGIAEQGALVCSCFAVREMAIKAAVKEGAASVEAVGELLKAGTNCGSCRPEIGRIVKSGCETVGAGALV